MKTLNKVQFLIIGILLLIVVTGCIPCYYAPNAQNVPLLTKKADGKLSFSGQVGAIAIGLNLQGAAAVSDHIGLIGNYHFDTGRGSQGELNGYEEWTDFKCNVGEIGLGYFMTFEEKYIFEAYAGYSGGKVKTEYNWWEGQGTSSMKSRGFFVQPALGFYKKGIEMAFSTRFRYLNFHDIEFDQGLSGSPKEYVDDVRFNPTTTFLEPAFTMRVGGEKVKFQFQAMGSFCLNGSQVFTHDVMNINCGIVFCFHKK